MVRPGSHNRKKRFREEKMSTEIEVGQRYRQVSTPWTLWKVVALTTRPGVVPHAYIARIGGPKDVKLMACSALRDRGFYQLEGSSPEKPRAA
jgi:hypothetical protein